MGLVSKTAKLNKQELDLLSFLVERTGTLAKDIILDAETNRIIFIVPSGNAGKIIGQKGETINGLRKDLHKDIDIVEYSSDIKKFLENLLRPAKITDINLKKNKTSDKTIVEIYVAQKDVGRAIGKQGQNLKRAKLVLDRQFDGIENIKVFPEPAHKMQQTKSMQEEKVDQQRTTDINENESQELTQKEKNKEPNNEDPVLTTIHENTSKEK